MPLTYGLFPAPRASRRASGPAAPGLAGALLGAALAAACGSPRPLAPYVPPYERAEPVDPGAGNADEGAPEPEASEERSATGEAAAGGGDPGPEAAGAGGEPAEPPGVAVDSSGPPTGDAAAADAAAPFPAPTRVTTPSLLPALEVEGLELLAPGGSLGPVTDWRISAADGTVSAVAGEGAGRVLVPLSALTLHADERGVRLVTLTLGDAGAPGPSEAAAPPAEPPADLFLESFARNERVTIAGVVTEVAPEVVAAPGTPPPDPVVLKVRDEDNHHHRVSTAPAPFLREADTLPAPGDRVVVEGLRARDASGALGVGRTLRRGTDLVALRDETGGPAWRAGDSDAAPPSGPLASEVRGLLVLADDGPLGRVADVALDLSSASGGEAIGAPAALLVEADGGTWLRVPWQALAFEEGALRAGGARETLVRAWAVEAADSAPAEASPADGEPPSEEQRPRVPDEDSADPPADGGP